MSTWALRCSAGFGGAPTGQGAHPLQEAAGHCCAALRQRQDRAVSLPELGRCLGRSLLPRAAQRAGGGSRRGQAQPLAQHLPLQSLTSPSHRIWPLSLSPALGSAQLPYGDQERCQQQWGSEQRMLPWGFNPAGMGSCRDGGGAEGGSACIPACPAWPSCQAPSSTMRPPPARLGSAQLCPGTTAPRCSPLLRWLLSFAAAND